MDDPNIRAAVDYFAKEFNLKLYYNGLAELKAQSVKTKENFTFFFIPFAEPTPKPELQHVVLSAEGPKGRVVHLATISTQPNEPPIVKDEKTVVDGKIQPGKDFFKNWAKCTVATCVAAITCIIAGPTWPACVCLQCGGAAIGCAVTEYLFP